jgi:uncharacterized membrane protein
MIASKIYINNGIKEKIIKIPAITKVILNTTFSTPLLVKEEE